MARYTRPKARVNRRLGALVYESAGASRALERRDSPPGMHARGRRTSNYGAALGEKQKIKHYYGMGEAQLRRYYQRACKMKGSTGEQMLIMCERRLDNVIRRAGLAKTRPQARQGVVHGHFHVNGARVTAPSYQLRPGDIVTIHATDRLKNLYQGIVANSQTEIPDWVAVDNAELKITVLGKPSGDDVSLYVDVNKVVEFLAR